VRELVRKLSSIEITDPRRRMTVGKIHDLLHKHMMDEELQIFPRIDQELSPEQSDQLAGRMQSMLERGPVMAGIQSAVEASPLGKVLESATS
jgi:hemerythrin-like domain-containing protein